MIWWTAFEIAINLFQGFLMIFFMKNQLHMRKKSILVDLGFILAIGCYQSLYLFFPIGVSDTVTFILPIIYGCINAEDRWYISLFWGVALAALFIVTISLITDLYMRIPSVSWAIANSVCCYLQHFPPIDYFSNNALDASARPALTASYGRICSPDRDSIAHS